MQFYEIPLSPSPQTFAIQLAGVTYNMLVQYHPANSESLIDVIGYDSDDQSLLDMNNLSAWVLSIFDSSNNPIVCGVPIISGIDLLYQYQYLNLGGSLIATVESDPDGIPSSSNLGITSHLYFVTFP